jgi:hypothetical protein
MICSTRQDDPAKCALSRPPVMTLLLATPRCHFALSHTASDNTLAFITTANKRQNAPGSKGVSKLVECIATGCVTLTPTHLRLCRVHYHECIAGKHPSLPLKTGDSATYNAATNKIVFPHLLATTDKPPANRAVRALAAGSSSTGHSKN